MLIEEAMIGQFNPVVVIFFYSIFVITILAITYF